MREISCEMCLDLMPLVQDGIASDDSVKAVKHHLEICPECKAVFEGEIPTLSEKKSKEMFSKIRRSSRVFLMALWLIGIFWGISLTNSNAIFFNSLIMPVIGILSYAAFKWKSLYILPATLLVTTLGAQLIEYVIDPLSYDFTPIWAVIYSIFAVAGVAIAGLLHFAFRKEPKGEEPKKQQS